MKSKRWLLIHAKGDERILGESDLVLQILKQHNEQLGIHWDVVSLLICSELQRIQSQMRIDAPDAKNHIISRAKNLR